MLKIQAEYIWLDGTDDQDVRSKTRIITPAPNVKIDMLDMDKMLGHILEWGFDGSSTMQAVGSNSDCILKPVLVIPDPLRIWVEDIINVLVLCEVMNADGTPHVTNYRPRLLVLDELYKSEKVWVALEQEYTLFKDGRPLGWPAQGEPDPQGPYYCSPDQNVGAQIAEAHKDICLSLGFELSGINAEVMLGQWEFQLGPISPKECADQLIFARWLLKRLALLIEGATVSFAPKPMSGDWNGAGAHINFSTEEMRLKGGISLVREAAARLERLHKEHLKVYGKNNEKRLTGDHETANMDTFRVGDSDRGASVRIPITTLQANSGYLEDRRPAANVNPYIAFSALLETILGEGFVPPEIESE